MKIYHSPNSNCVGESFFVYFLRQHFPQAEYIVRRNTVELESLKNFVQTGKLIEALETDLLLPTKRKINCIKRLKESPEKLKVALNRNKITFDVVIKSEGKTFYWEYHERQHRNLSVSRNSKIYDAENDDPINVPRYLQRLIRDVWRVQHFSNYTIVWEDWFVANCYDYQPSLQQGFYEHFIDGKFSFGEFCI